MHSNKSVQDYLSGKYEELSASAHPKSIAKRASRNGYRSAADSSGSEAEERTAKLRRLEACQSHDNE